MKVSFGSTYAVKYEYVDNPVVKGCKDRSYVAKNPCVDIFISELGKCYKSPHDVSSYNPEKKLYFLNIQNSSDRKLENLAKILKVKIHKVKREEMNGTQIVLMGYSDDVNYELNKIDKMNIHYNYLQHKEHMEQSCRAYEGPFAAD